MSNRPSKKKPRSQPGRSGSSLRPAARPAGRSGAHKKVPEAEPPPRRIVWVLAGVGALIIVAAIVAVVVTRAKSEPTADAPPVLDAQATRGHQIAQDKGCLSCHSTTGGPSEGPTWKGIYGQPVKLRDGSTATVDDRYLGRAITQPKIDVVAGYQPDMPANQLTEDEISAVIAYIKALR